MGAKLDQIRIGIRTQRTGSGSTSIAGSRRGILVLLLMAGFVLNAAAQRQSSLQVWESTLQPGQQIWPPPPIGNFYLLSRGGTNFIPLPCLRNATYTEDNCSITYLGPFLRFLVDDTAIVAARTLMEREGITLPAVKWKWIKTTDLE